MSGLASDFRVSLGRTFPWLCSKCGLVPRALVFAALLWNSLLISTSTQPLSSKSVCVLSYSAASWLFVTPWIVVHQAPLFMGFFRQEYWRGLPFPSPGNLLNSDIYPCLLCLLHCRQILYLLSHLQRHQGHSLDKCLFSCMYW